MFMVDEHPDWKISTIIDNQLYLGAREGAEDEEIIKERNIQSILSICTCSVAVPSMIKEYKMIELDDDPNETIDHYFDTAFEFLDNCTKPVLVHCEAGMSRSATIVIAWLMHQGKTLNQAYRYVKEKRTLISPNNGFFNKLYLLQFSYHSLLHSLALQKIGLKRRKSKLCGTLWQSRF